MSAGSNTAHTTETTWYACDENGDNGIPITDENGDPTYPKTPTAGVHYYYVLVTATRKDNGLASQHKKQCSLCNGDKSHAENHRAANGCRAGSGQGQHPGCQRPDRRHCQKQQHPLRTQRRGGPLCVEGRRFQAAPRWKRYAVVFQPDDTQNYEPAQTTVYVNVTCNHRFGDWNAGRRTCAVCGEVETRTNTVTVTWGELAYTYTDGAWNPATHDYDIGGGWAPNRKNGDVITVQNEGASEVRVKFQYTRTDTAIGGSFANSDGDYIYSPIDLPVNRTQTVRLCLTGRPGKALNNAKIGSVTVRLEGGY